MVNGQWLIQKSKKSKIKNQKSKIQIFSAKIRKKFDPDKWILSCPKKYFPFFFVFLIFIRNFAPKNKIQVSWMGKKYQI